MHDHREHKTTAWTPLNPDIDPDQEVSVVEGRAGNCRIDIYSVDHPELVISEEERFDVKNWHWAEIGFPSETQRTIAVYNNHVTLRQACRIAAQLDVTLHPTLHNLLTENPSPSH